MLYGCLAFLYRWQKDPKWCPDKPEVSSLNDLVLTLWTVVTLKSTKARNTVN